MSSIVVAGDVSGSITLQAPAVSGSTVLTLPAVSGTVAITSGYQYIQTLYYTTSGTFTKATYPLLRAIRVKCVGGGGGGGGVGATAAGTFVASCGGGGGGYAEGFITDIVGLVSSVTVTVGTGGAGGVAGANNGTVGNTSSFGAVVQGYGAAAGQGQVPQTFWIINGSGAGGSGIGDLVITGGGGGVANPVNTNGGYGGIGGSTVLGQSTAPAASWQSSVAGVNGNLYGTGGSGATSGALQTAKAGGNGAAGIVIIELYA